MANNGGVIRSHRGEMNVSFLGCLGIKSSNEAKALAIF